MNLTKYLTVNKLKKNCLYLKFANNCVQETTYALWLKKQREGLHQKTAMHLESQAHKCRPCGGGAFLPYNKNAEHESSGARTTMGEYYTGMNDSILDRVLLMQSPCLTKPSCGKSITQKSWVSGTPGLLSQAKLTK